jgi:uncharacterized SAM-dependent methyltransferase
MKTIIQLIGLLLISTFANAVTIIPSEVSKNFKNEYPNATHTKWKHVNHYYEVHFVMGEYEHAALFDKEGKKIKAITFIEHFHDEESTSIDSIVHYNQPKAHTVMIAKYDSSTSQNSYIVIYEANKHLYEMYLDKEKHITHIAEFKH